MTISLAGAPWVHSQRQIEVWWSHASLIYLVETIVAWPLPAETIYSKHLFTIYSGHAVSVFGDEAVDNIAESRGPYTSVNSGIFASYSSLMKLMILA